MDHVPKTDITRKPSIVGRTARCHCIFQYLSKYTAAYTSPRDSTAYV